MAAMLGFGKGFFVVPGSSRPIRPSTNKPLLYPAIIYPAVLLRNVVGTSCMGNYYVPNTYCIITYILCPGGTQRNHTQLTYLDTAIHSYTQL